MFGNMVHHQRGQVISTLGSALGKPIMLEDLRSDEQKKKLGLDLEK